MDHREIAEEATRLRDELSDLGDQTPELQQRIKNLGRSIERLRHDLNEMRTGPTTVDDALSGPSPESEVIPEMPDE